MKRKISKIISMILTLLTMITVIPLPIVKADSIGAFQGKTISILGDSISTYENISCGEAANTTNTTILNNRPYYMDDRTDVNLNDTWWMQAANTIGARILVNNSYSNTTVFSPSSTDDSLGYYTRPNNLHDNTGENAGEQPDIIAVFIGTNDVSYHKSCVGSFDAINFNTLYTNKNGVYTYKKPATTCEAYAIMLHKITNNYKNSEVYCFNLFPRYFENATDTKIYTELNNSIALLAKKFNCYLVDVNNNISAPDNKEAINRYLTDNFVHPNQAGMDIICNAFLSSLYNNSKYIQDKNKYDVTYNTSDVIFKNGKLTKAVENSAFDCELFPEYYGKLNVTVKMNNVDITNSAFKNNRIYIDNVTGNIEINASVSDITRTLKNYRFIEYNNTLTNVIDSENYANPVIANDNNNIGLTNNINLYYDKNWAFVIRTDAKSKGEIPLLSSDECNFSLVINKTESIIGFKNKTTNEIWGLDFSHSNIRIADINTYKITNTYNNFDGSNIFTLYIDSEKIGEFNTLYKDLEKTGCFYNGINEVDLTFNSVYTNITTEYIQIWEDDTFSNHTHTFSYNKTLEATCEEPKTLVSICDCGAINSERIGEPLGHTPGEWITGKPASALENGELQKICKVCNKIAETKIIPQLKCVAPCILSLSNTEDGIKVSWNNVEGADYYRVYHRTINGSWVYLGTTTSTYYFDTNVKSGYWYYYTVRAVNEAGFSDYEKQGKLIQALNTPGFTSITNIHKGINLNWNKVTAAKGYYIYRKAGNENWQYYTKTTSTTYTDTKVTNGVNYQYRIKAFRNNTVSGFHYVPVTLKRFASPQIKSLTNVEAGIKVQWNSLSGAKGYYVYRKTGNGSWKYLGHTYSTVFTDTTAKAGYTYNYTVKAYDSNGNNSSYNPYGLKYKRLTTPNVYDYDVVYNGIKLKWYGVTGANGYYVYRKTGNGQWEYLGKTTGKTFTDKTAKKGTTYTYTVKAYSGSYISGYNTKGISAKR